MPVDVLTETTIHRPLMEVAQFAADPANAPQWYVNIKAVEWKTEPVVRVGAKAAFVAHFLGRKLSYTYQIAVYEPNAKLVMRTAEGPFPMETSYSWEATGAASTRMALRNRGEPKGFSMVMAPILAAAMRQANTKDLAKLKALLEAREPIR
jgi:hypothetical protein